MGRTLMAHRPPPASFRLTHRLLRGHGLTVALLAALLLALVRPSLGASAGPLYTGALTWWGVILIFFLQGLKLPTGELLRGVSHWRLHALIQAWVFLLVPVLWLPGWLLLRQTGSPELAAGILYLALLPTTITSAIVMTTAAGGNAAASMVSTALANMIGVLWVPAWALVLLGGSGTHTAAVAGPLFAKLAYMIVLPLVVGQCLRPWVRDQSWFARAARHFGTVTHAIIVLIVYTAFCDSLLARVWSTLAPGALAQLVAVIISGALLIHGAVWWSARRWVPHAGDRIAVLFCGAQKTLATGAPMALAIFVAAPPSGVPHVGILLLPLLVYHPVQLILASVLVPALRRTTELSTAGQVS
jgi:solute carrier family 10 (sodium/bile acid cotransporter), member 7